MSLQRLDFHPNLNNEGINVQAEKHRWESRVERHQKQGKSDETDVRQVCREIRTKPQNNRTKITRFTFTYANNIWTNSSSSQLSPSSGVAWGEGALVHTAECLLTFSAVGVLFSLEDKGGLVVLFLRFFSFIS